jgi:hypothetical protein
MLYQVIVVALGIVLAIGIICAIPYLLAALKFVFLVIAPYTIGFVLSIAIQKQSNICFWITVLSILSVFLGRKIINGLGNHYWDLDEGHWFGLILGSPAIVVLLICL